MIGGQDLSKYLINFNASEWANQANAQLQSSLNQGLQYSEKYFQPSVSAVQDYDKQARNDVSQGFAQHQALDAPKHLATYNALDAYQGLLGLPTPVGGSFQLAGALQNANQGQPNTAQQQQQVAGYMQGLQNQPQGLLSNVPPQNQGY